MGSAEGFQLLASGDAEGAAEAFSRALAEHPSDADALLGLARVRMAQRQLEDARAALERLVAIRPSREAESHLALIDALSGDDAALGRLRELAAAPGAGFYERFDLGLVLAARGDLPGAERALEGALELEPRSVHAAVELGKLALDRGDSALAVQRFTRAAAAAPALSLPLALLARAHLARGERGAAIRALARALERAPNEKPLYEQLVRVCLDAGAPKQAAAAAAELRRIDPASARAALLEGEATLAMGRSEEAKRIFARARELASGSWEPDYWLARAHRAAGDLEQAFVLLERCAAAAPEQPGPAAELASILLARGQSDRARAVLARTLSTHPEDARAHLLMARAIAREDRSAAIAHARRAARAADPDLRDQAEKLLREL